MTNTILIKDDSKADYVPELVADGQNQLWSKPLPGPEAPTGGMGSPQCWLWSVAATGTGQ